MSPPRKKTRSHIMLFLFAMQMWIFDLPDGGGRLLRYREGHNAPPNKIRFHGNNGKNIISAGQDSTLRTFSTVKDHLNKNMGQASFNRKAAKRKSVRLDPKKMPPITDFTSGGLLRLLPSEICQFKDQSWINDK